MRSGKSWLEISSARLRHNYGVLVEAATAGGMALPVLAVVKANGYGHGAELCAPVLAAAGAPWLGVTDADEGLRVRRELLDAGPWDERDVPGVLVMCGLLPGDARSVVDHGLTAVVWTPEQVSWMAAAAKAGSRIVDVHVEVDTGMSRQGVRPGAELNGLLDALEGARGLRVSGVMTHFADAEVAGSAQTAMQRKQFAAAMEQMGARSLRPDWVHAGNTSTIDEGSSLPWLVALARQYGARAMVRSGLALFGYSLPLEGGVGSFGERLERVMTWRSRVLAVEEVSAGATVGYNGTFQAREQMSLALLPVGYADGLRRELSATTEAPGGWVMVRGRRAPIVGRISMNLTTVDVTGINSVAAGEEVTVLGDGVGADDHARLAGTIAYEILCGVRAPAELTA